MTVSSVTGNWSGLLGVGVVALVDLVIRGVTRVGGTAGCFIRSSSFSWGEKGLGLANISHKIGDKLQTTEVSVATVGRVLNEISVDLMTSRKLAAEVSIKRSSG